MCVVGMVMRITRNNVGIGRALATLLRTCIRLLSDSHCDADDAMTIIIEQHIQRRSDISLVRCGFSGRKGGML